MNDPKTPAELGSLAVQQLAETLARAITAAQSTVTVTETVTLSTSSRWTRERLFKVPSGTVLTTPEVAEALGKSVSCIHKLAKRGRLPFHRLKKKHSRAAGPPYAYRAGDVRRYLEGTGGR
jgi:excisionase family DNA binding protein